MITKPIDIDSIDFSRLRVCHDVYLGGNQIVAAAKTAKEENPDNVPEKQSAFAVFEAHPDLIQPIHLAALTGKMWPAGRVVTICFLDGTHIQRNKVMKYAVAWEQHANIKFKFVAGTSAECRITFKEESSWSFLGMDALQRAANEPTMCYGWVTNTSDAAEDQTVVEHEFGHMLGFGHEHSHPKNGIQWNKPVVYAYYKRIGWDEPMVDQQVFKKYSASQVKLGDYDEDSIMHYPIEEVFTQNDFFVGWNKHISAGDKMYSRMAYPGSIVIPIPPVVIPPVPISQEVREVIGKAAAAMKGIAQDFEKLLQATK